MKYLSDEKLLIVGAGGMIGSNMAQTALMLGLTPNICLYDIFEPGVHGVAEEIYHCAFEGANVTWTTDPAVAFKDAKYIISSGGAPRKEGMTREDLLKGNCEIAEQLGIKESSSASQYLRAKKLLAKKINDYLNTLNEKEYE